MGELRMSLVKSLGTSVFHKVNFFKIMELFRVFHILVFVVNI
jgi:hypothetical protein